MKAISVSICTFIVLHLGCQSKTNMQGVESITIVSNLRSTEEDSVLLSNDKAIKTITDIISSAKREPVKFLADYRLEIKFRDSTKVLLVNKDLLNIQGITYRLHEDLGKQIENIKAIQ